MVDLTQLKSLTKELADLHEVKSVLINTLDGNTNEGQHRLSVGVNGSAVYSAATVDSKAVYTMLKDTLDERITEVLEAVNKLVAAQ